MTKPITEIKKIRKIASSLHKKGDEYFVLFSIGVQTGIPVNEVCLLKTSDIDFSKKCVKNYEHGCLGDTLALQIRAYVMANNLNDDDFLISLPNRRDQPINRIRLYRLLRKTGEAVGCPGLCEETIRKTFGYFHYQTHQDIKAIQGFFHQQSPSITARYIGVDIAGKKSTSRPLALKLEDTKNAL